jgi:alpha-N-arabinofuranosidase
MPDRIVISSKVLFEDTISPFIYGDFIELLNDLIPGMWAEKIQDKNFAGILQPNCIYPPGANWVYPRWKPFVSGQPNFNRWPDSHHDTEMVKATATIELDTNNPFVGQQSAKIAVQGSDRPCVAGIMQENIAVKQGQTLNVEMYIRGHGFEGHPVKVLIGRDYGVFFRAYCSLDFSGITEEWQTFEGKLTPEISDDSASIAIGIPCEGTFWLSKVSLMPEDNRFGWRPDVVEAIKAMKPGIIRFGGSTLIFYKWQIGIGPNAQRAPFINNPWGNMEENDVGIYEFMEFCELVEAEPLMCINSNSATLVEIMDEIEFCNGAEDSKYGKIRAEMGHPKPFNVKYWQIGNEQSGVEYEKRMIEFTQAIRSKHPDLIILAAFPSDNIIYNLSDEIDYVCPHFYTPYNQDREREMRNLIGNIRQKAKNKNLKLGITEWNHTAGHWGWGRSWLLTLYNALNAGRTLNMYQRLGDMIKIANRSNMTNSCNSGVIQTNRSDIYFTPCYYVQKAYANLAGDIALEIEAGADEVLDTSATQRQKDGEIALFVVNYSGDVQTRKIDVSDLNITNNWVNIWMLSGNSLESVNSFQKKDCVVPKEFIVEFRSREFEYKFPAYSVTILRFK